MKYFISAFIVLMCSNFLNGQNFSREDAIRKAITEFIVPPTLDHSVTAYITSNPLQSGDAIVPFIDGKEKTIKRPTWFVWINDNPEAMFAHTTRYLFIDAENGNHELIFHKWWPEHNGQSLFMSEEERTDLSLIIYSDLHRSRIDKN